VSGSGPADGATAGVEAAVTAVWRREQTRLVAALARMTRDLDLAEDLAQDALVAALESWPGAGVPPNPGGWLMQVAKRRGIDHFRRADTLRRRTSELAHDLSRQEEDVPDLAAAVDHIEDDVLRLMFLTCHPALPPESRAALTLRMVCGLGTEEIARGFTVRSTTMGQRISRAKRTLATAQASFEAPVGPEREARLGDVMGAVYLVFNEGYTATTGPDWMRPDLCFEAVRLARMLTALAPDEPEVHGLQSLLELQASRTHARTGPGGEPVLLEDQDRRRWDHLLLRRGLRALDRAVATSSHTDRPVGRYVLQAEIAACHARARRPADTDWARIAAVYDVLADTAPGPVVELNRAVAHGRAHGPEAGLAVLDGVALPGSHLVHAVRGDLLQRAGREADAATSFREAADLTDNRQERDLLLSRAADATRSS
jgi:RNA polymerase sigma factor (sigma-70 family)